MVRRYFEPLKVGQTLAHEIRRTVRETDDILFSPLTNTPAAVPIDHEDAKAREFGKPLINSIFTLGGVVGLPAQEATFAKPIRAKSNVVRGRRRVALMTGKPV